MGKIGFIHVGTPGALFGLRLVMGSKILRKNAHPSWYIMLVLCVPCALAALRNWFECAASAKLLTDPRRSSAYSLGLPLMRAASIPRLVHWILFNDNSCFEVALIPQAVFAPACQTRPTCHHSRTVRMRQDTPCNGEARSSVPTGSDLQFCPLHNAKY